jgi:hypothetical protein
MVSQRKDDDLRLRDYVTGGRARRNLLKKLSFRAICC